ncbi:MAG TPA: Flp family type IVb pilin [Symbiobacteriaceae bacterium]|nr:Flp family type IVb pilin [Symbiobacteriaceae bacterium]
MWMLKARRFLERKDGQGMAEYALILALVAIVAIVGVMLLGPKLKSVFQSIANHL